MGDISLRRHRFPPPINLACGLRFTLSYRDIEELAERGLDISYETVRCWVLKSGLVIARRLRGAVRGRAIDEHRSAQRAENSSPRAEDPAWITTGRPCGERGTVKVPLDCR
jgi:hypothetical protein